MQRHSKTLIKPGLVAHVLNHERKRQVCLLAAIMVAGSVLSATIADFGTTAPTPGGIDIAQLTAGSDRDGLNYYSDNGTPPGQTFTTGSNPSGYGLTALYVKTGGYDGNNTTTLQSYTLRVYSVSSATATLLSTYVTDNLLGFVDGAWLKYSGLTNILQPNTVYAYTHHRNSSGWDGMSAVLGNLYAGGEICLIPTAGGAISFGGSHNSDAAFMANLSPITDPFVFPTTITPSSAVAGSSVVISAGVASGTQPISYQWQFTGTSGATLIPNATSITYTIASAQVTNQGSYSLIVSNRPGGVPTVITNTPASLAVRSAYNISTLGTTPPATGTYDIAQLTAGTDMDGLNYFADNGNPPRQTFITGSNPAGYTLTAIQLKTAGNNSSSTGTAKTYTLRLYSISGSTATLISTCLSDSTVGFTDGDWLKYTGMTNVLQPSTVYAYTHRQNGSGWDQLSAVLGNLYAGGQACLIPIAGGTITTGGSGTLDATFQVSMVPNGFPAIQNVSISPANSAGNPVYVPTQVTLSVQASGASPLHYQWQTDNGLGGAFGDISNSNTNSYALATTGMSPGTYLYQVIVTNVNNAATSSVVTLHLSAASAPVLVTDTTITPSAVYVGGGVQMSAAFNGSTPITYQWKFDNGSGPVVIAGATNATYSIGTAQLANNGSYFLAASNGIPPFTTSSTPVGLLVGALPQNNASSAGMLDATSSAPTPGTYDIAQLVTAPPTAVPGLNYYVNNAAPPGQTFTTLGAAPNGYRLSSLYMQEELSTVGGGGDASATYTLGIYSVSGNNAILITSYTSTNAPAITEGDWLQWVGLTNVLAANRKYAFSLHKDTGSGWWKLANNSTASDLYGGGQVALLPISGAGALVFSTDTTIDAGFLVALAPASGVNLNRTNITFGINGGNLSLSWPADHQGWYAQSNSVSVANASAWHDIPNSQNGTSLSIPVDHTKSVFFRLRSPQ
jgi:hypothetical protein